MKFLSLRTVYRVFPIIKHSKTLGPLPVPTPGPIDLKKYSVCSSYQGLSTCQISSRSVEKWRRNCGMLLVVKKNKKELWPQRSRWPLWSVWPNLWPQKVTGSLEVTVTYFMTLKVTVTFVVGLTQFMTPRGHGVTRGQLDLLYDP